MHNDHKHDHDPGCPGDAHGHDHAHEHGPGHDHDHAGHAHAHTADMTSADSRRRVVLAALLTGGFMLAEVIGGILSGSLALMADAAHMLTDTGSLLLAWLGYKLAARPADPGRSFGFGRMKVLAAFTNGVLLILLALWIVWEAVNRLLSPAPILGELMLGVAVLGLVVNIMAFAILHGGGHSHDLNLRGALWHVAGDMLGSVAAILAAVLILWQGWYIADPLLSILVAGLALFGGVRIAREAGHILIEGTPEGLEAAKIIADLKANVPGVANVSHVHAWALTESRPLVTLEVTLTAGASAESVRRAVKERLAHAFGASHATVEVIGEVSPSAA